MIPKKIHYVWLSDDDYPPLIKKCLASWKIHCPDYEIILWNTKNFDINKNLYCKQAYENKKWAFATDYIRLSILYEHGGIYLDSDCEVLKPLNNFLHLNAFSGMEKTDFGRYYIGAHFIAAKQGNPWIKSMLNYYDNISFIDKKSNFDLTAMPYIMAFLTKKFYSKFEYKNEEQHFEYCSLYPFDYFTAKEGCEANIYITENTYVIHHFTGTWLPVNHTLKWLPNYEITRKILKLIKSIIGKEFWFKIKTKHMIKINNKLEKKVIQVLEKKTNDT